MFVYILQKNQILFTFSKMSAVFLHIQKFFKKLAICLHFQKKVSCLFTYKSTSVACLKLEKMLTCLNAETE